MAQQRTLTIFNIRPQAFNVGNHVISLGLHYFMTEAFGRFVNLISLPAISRYETQAKAGLTRKVIHEINTFGDGVIVGGGNLYENGEIAVDVEALDALEPPLMIFSVSKGRVFNREDQLVGRTDTIPDSRLAALNRRANYSLARDNATLAELERVGITHAEMGGCPTLFLDRIADRLPATPEVDKGTTLITIRTPDLMSISLKRQAKVRGEILAIADFLRGEGHQDIRILCHDHRDIAFAASLDGLPYHYTGDMYAYLSLLRGAKLVITYRLHAALPCFSYGIPTIPVSYDERALSAMESFGLGDWNIDMVRGGDPVENVKDRYRRLNELPEILNRARHKEWAQVEEVMRRSFAGFVKDVTAYNGRQP
jgi:polysaccharide pyruvyl transferase WcaK-like protein